MFWEVFKFTSNIVYNVKNMLKKDYIPNELSILIHGKFIEVRNKTIYYIQKENTIVNETSLLTLINMDRLNKITTNFFLAYIILYTRTKTYNLELQSA